VGVANYWSAHSRIVNDKKEDSKPGQQEWLVVFCRELLQTHFYDYLVFGHRHLPLDIQLNDKSRYINLGEWVNASSYGVFDGETVGLKYFEKVE
jgi:UDP-2,3-diacylglucosamine hydrolase